MCFCTHKVSYRQTLHAKVWPRMRSNFSVLGSFVDLGISLNDIMSAQEPQANLEEDVHILSSLASFTAHPGHP